MDNKTKEYFLLIIAVLFGLIVAVFVAPKSKFFFSNFAWYWGPQVIIFVLIIVFRFRIGVLTGCALILGLFLLGFHSSVVSLSRPEPFLWFFYDFSFIGAIVGVFVAGVYSKNNSSLNNFQTIGISAITTALGLIISLIIMGAIPVFK